MNANSCNNWTQQEWLAFETKFEDAIAGRASESAVEEVNRQLEGDQQLRIWAVERLQDECLIREEMSLLEAVSELTEYSRLRKSERSAKTTGQLSNIGALLSQDDLNFFQANSLSWRMAAVAATLLLICSLMINAFFWQEKDVPNLQANSGVHPTARLVRETGCTWHSSGEPVLSLGETLSGGKSLELLEGIAEIHFQQEFASGLVKIQGPGAVMPRADGVPILLHGKLSLEVNLHGGQFALETPFGQVELHRSSSFGLLAEEGQMQIHVFDGELTIHSTWLDEQDAQFAKLESGEALIFDKADVKWELAASDLFASDLSMFSDQLAVGNEYAQAVMASNPLNYWRFNDSPEAHLGSGRMLKNEVDDGMSLYVAGSVTSVRQPGNRVLEFGMTRDSGYLHSKGDWSPDSLEEYSIECWLKPSHFHNGALLSLIDSKFPDSKRGIHGLLLEIGGPHNLTARHTLPNSIRFMGRDPHLRPEKDMAELGLANSYQVRKWTHIAAVGKLDAMQLYVNGELVAENQNSRPQSGQQKLIIGQVFFDRPERRFIGQLDEMAIYGRALSEQEIRTHYNLGIGSQTQLNQKSHGRSLSMRSDFSL